MLSRQPLQRSRNISRAGGDRGQAWWSVRKRKTSGRTDQGETRETTSLRRPGLWRPLGPAILILASLGGCSDGGAGEAAMERSSARATADCFDPGLRETVEQFGERIRQVSLLAPDSLVRPEIQSAYGEFVTPELLSAWIQDPSSAPGRKVSSPWPERIEVTGVDPSGDGGCTVQGELVYSSSADAGPAERVTVTVRRQGGWRIAGYSAQPQP